MATPTDGPVTYAPITDMEKTIVTMCGALDKVAHAADKELSSMQQEFKREFDDIYGKIDRMREGVKSSTENAKEQVAEHLRKMSAFVDNYSVPRIAGDDGEPSPRGLHLNGRHAG